MFVVSDKNAGMQRALLAINLLLHHWPYPQLGAGGVTLLRQKFCRQITKCADSVGNLGTQEEELGAVVCRKAH